MGCGSLAWRDCAAVAAAVLRKMMSVLENFILRSGEEVLADDR